MPRTTTVHAVATIGMDMGKKTLHMIGLNTRGAIPLASGDREASEPMSDLQRDATHPARPIGRVEFRNGATKCRNASNNYPICDALGALELLGKRGTRWGQVSHEA